MHETSIPALKELAGLDFAWSYDPFDRMIDTALLLAPPALRMVDRTIFPGDEMLLHDVSRFHDWSRAAAEYFVAGLSLMSTVRQLVAWRFGSWSKLDSFLDFACGHGRLSRFLVKEMEPKRIWVSDIVPSAVEFQKTAFGVNGFLSTPGPPELNVATNFDFIFAASLFSHLPEDLFRGWLKKLVGLLAPGGVMAFSVHDIFLMQSIAPAGSGRQQHYFAPESESRTLDKSIYGTAWVSEEFVRDALGQNQQIELRRIPRGLCNYQDLYVVGRGVGDLWPALTVDSGPLGFLEYCSLDSGRLELSGWATHLVPGRAVESIGIYLDDVEIAVLSSFFERDDLPAEFSIAGRKPVGFRLSLDLPSRRSTSDIVLLIKAVSDADQHSSIFIGTLESAQRSSLVLQRDFLGRRLVELETSSAAERERLVAEMRAAQRHIEMMQASRFWKMRELWFRLRELLGLSS